MQDSAASARNAGQPFTGRRILIVEDEYFLADDLAKEFARRGADIVGPLGEVVEAIELLKAGTRIDAALLDINVRNQLIFPLARALRQHRIPFAFTTGYDKGWVDPEFADVPLCEKPFDMAAVANCLIGLMQQS